MKNQITISESDVFDAYKNGTQEVKKLLEKLFGEDTFKPKDITERVKTFEDACIELGRENCLVQDYLSTTDKTSSDLLAYIKLRIICAALNEGWKPQFTENEKRYHPWFILWTKDELLDKSDEWKTTRHLISTDKYQTDYVGFTFADADYVPSPTYTYVGSCLCLKSATLARYCGKQFIDLWVDFSLIREGK